MRAFLLLFLLLASSKLLAEAGGGFGGGFGGGGGMAGRSFVPQWTLKGDAVAKAKRNGSKVIIFALAGEKKKVELWDQDFETMSVTVPFVELTGAQAADFAKQWQIEALPAVAVADEFGNILWSECTVMSPGKLRAGIDTVKSSAPTLQKKLDDAVAQATKAYGKEQVAVALQRLDKVLAYEGYYAVDQAKMLRNQIIADGLGKVEQGRTLAKTDAKRAKASLREQVSGYRGTEVAEQAALALKDLEGRP